MPNVQVTNTLVAANGLPISNTKITIMLYGSWWVDGVHESIQSSVWEGFTNELGVWIATLPSQSTYEGPTYYEVREPNAKAHAFTLTDSPPLQQLRSRLVDPIPYPQDAPLKLDDLSDVTVVSPSTGQFLSYNGTQWIPQTVTPSGAGTATQIVTQGIAAINLSGHRVVTKRSDGAIDYASNNNIQHLHVPLWLTKNAANQSTIVDLLAYGPIEEGSWTWVNGPVFLGANGLLTQTPPTSPLAVFITQIAYAMTPTSIFVDRQPSIVLG